MRAHDFAAAVVIELRRLFRYIMTKEMGDCRLTGADKNTAVVAELLVVRFVFLLMIHGH